MVRKLKPGEICYFNYNEKKQYKLRGDGQDIWVDENNYLHNENNSPARIWYNSDGRVERKIWCRHGLRENLNGAGEITYNPIGEMVKSWYYIHGKPYQNKQDWEIEVNRIKTLEEL